MKTNLRRITAAVKDVRRTYKTLLEVLPSAIILSQIMKCKTLSVLNGTPGEKFQIKVAENRLEITFY